MTPKAVSMRNSADSPSRTKAALALSEVVSSNLVRRGTGGHLLGAALTGAGAAGAGAAGAGAGEAGALLPSICASRSAFSWRSWDSFLFLGFGLGTSRVDLGRGFSLRILGTGTTTRCSGATATNEGNQRNQGQGKSDATHDNLWSFRSSVHTLVRGKTGSMYAASSKQVNQNPPPAAPESGFCALENRRIRGREQRPPSRRTGSWKRHSKSPH